MKRTIPAIAFATAGLLGAIQIAQADGCRREEEFDARPIMKRAQDAEQAGRFKDAHAETRRIYQEPCATGVDDRQIKTFRTRVARKQAELDEKQGRFADAADWFGKTESYADVDRVMMKHAKSAPTDLRVFGGAFNYFDRGRQAGRSEAHVAELKKMAAANGERELANEEKRFTPLRTTTDELEKARDWYRYVDGGEKKVLDRAVKRGDTLAKDDAVGPLERALAYYRYAHDAAKEKQVKDRAAKLGDTHAGKGEHALAVRYYELAGQNEKARQLGARAEAQQQKSETQRKQQFDKDQKALEKELGL
jgi:hypothetical protein